jgi:type II secretory pathway pseudopilin PulG
MGNQKGQSLVEMIVVVGMVILLVTGIVAGTTASLGRSETTQARSDALTFAQAGIELARGQRDNGWTAFEAMGSVGGTKYCVGSDQIWRDPPCLSNIDSKYTRSVTLQFAPVSSVPTMTVTSQVLWGDTTDPSNTVQLTTYLTQWK